MAYGTCLVTSLAKQAQILNNTLQREDERLRKHTVLGDNPFLLSEGLVQAGDGYQGRGCGV